jgi:hypothetical protein
VPNHWLLITLLGTPVLTGIFSGVRQWQILPCFLAVYLLVIIIWPWPPPRRVIPVLMFLLVYLLNETWAIFKRIKGERTRKVIAGVAGVLLIVGNLWETNQVASFNHKMHYPSMLTSANQPVAWSSFLHMFDWIKTNTNTTDIIASPFDSMIFLYTGRRGFRPFIMRPTSLFYGKSTPAHDTANEFLEILKNNQAKYLISVPMLHFAEEKPYEKNIEEIQREHIGSLSLVYKGSDTRFQLFKISKQ